MSELNKISPAFQPFLDEAKANDTRDAIVIYRPAPQARPVRVRRKTLQRKRAAVKRAATQRQKLETSVYNKYKRAASEHFQSKPEKKPLHRSIGSSALPVFATQITRKSLDDLAEQPDVVAVLPNQKIQLIKPREINYDRLARTEARNGLTWGLKQLEIPEMWEKTQGADINVAVLDTGVHGDHPAFARGSASKVTDFLVVDPLGRRITAEPMFDGAMHGTHVCGTIAGGQDDTGVSIGVAPKANLLAAGVLVGDSTLLTLFEGLSWAVEKGADIVNMSLGFTYYEPLFTVFLQMLLNEYGVLPVVSVGNENHGNTSSPGNAHSAFSVGAVEKLPRNKVDVPYFSSGASLVFPGEDPEMVTKPDVVAPGSQIWSAIPPQREDDQVYWYTYMDGTSMASPHVAGVAALLMAAEPNSPVTDIMEVLKETAKHPTGNRPDNRWGYGVVQPLEALAALQS